MQEQEKDSWLLMSEARADERVSSFVSRLLWQAQMGNGATKTQSHTQCTWTQMLQSLPQNQIFIIGTHLEMLIPGEGFTRTHQVFV